MKYLTWKFASPPNFRNVPEKPGIYIISTQQEIDHEFEVKYIGHADNLFARANEHWSPKERNPVLKAHIEESYIMKFNYSLVESDEEREGMVSYLHTKLQPPFNKAPNDGIEMIKCTVPAVRKQI